MILNQWYSLGFSYLKIEISIILVLFVKYPNDLTPTGKLVNIFCLIKSFEIGFFLQMRDTHWENVIEWRWIR